MKVSVLALDYDGTIARGDVVEQPVRDAIAAVRTSGTFVLLVTGRILSELQRVAGDLHFVDAVVAENGAVIYFPDTGHTTLLAPPLPENFVLEVRRRRIRSDCGECLLDAEADEAPRLLEVIRMLELPLVLLFNPGPAAQPFSLPAGRWGVRLDSSGTLDTGPLPNGHLTAPGRSLVVLQSL